MVKINKINVNLYGGKSIFGGRESPLEADEIYCDRANECTFYKENKCLRCRSFFASTCKFGKNNVVKGYTSRATKYYDFKNKYVNDAVYNKLSYPRGRIAVMGDTLYMNLAYVSVRKRTESDDKWQRDTEGYIVNNKYFGSGSVFLPMSDATNTLLNAIFSYSPRSMYGDLIKDYKEKIVPNILQDLKKVASDIYTRFVDEYPEYIFVPNYIGQTAYISSLKPNTKFMHKDKEWLYDGEYVSTTNLYLGTSSPWWMHGGAYADVKIKVSDDMCFEVHDNSIVDENTKFK